MLEYQFGDVGRRHSALLHQLEAQLLRLGEGHRSRQKASDGVGDFRGERMTIKKGVCVEVARHGGNISGRHDAIIRSGVDEEVDEDASSPGQ